MEDRNGSIDQKAEQTGRTEQPDLKNGTGGSSAPRQVNNFPLRVVGIGASAGGLEALQQLFSAMPGNTGLCFVIAMHLPADRPSLLPELLKHYSPLPIISATDGCLLKPDTVYLTPAGGELLVRNHHLVGIDSEENRMAGHSIDRFFFSLAEDQAENAIALILSGAGNDGAQGAAAIRKAGGTVIIQDLGQALFPSMPQSALTAGAADLALPVSKMPDKIIEIVGRPTSRPSSVEPDATRDELRAAILQLVHAATGHNFSSYKSATIQRRIERRMAMAGQPDMRSYLEHLRGHPEEAAALYNDILIGVTSFFRDPEAFESLRTLVIPRLFENRPPDDPVRIWHPCCSTGEEVYSMAILIQEYLKQQTATRVQIFATDLDDAAVSQARKGLYGAGIAPAVGEERLAAWFSQVEDHYLIAKPLREMVIFARHSLLKDPPFSRLDLVVCRNFLIYLDQSMQNRLIPMFHQVLKPGGHLFLGASESIGRQSDLFGPVDRKWKIFRRKEAKRRAGMLLPLAVPSLELADQNRFLASPPSEDHGTGLVVEKLLMERFVPPCAVVNDKFDILYLANLTSRFLVRQIGEPTRDLLKLVRDELRGPLRAAIHKAIADQHQVAFRGMRVFSEGETGTVNLTVEPLPPASPAGKTAMVVFELAPSAPAVPDIPDVRVVRHVSSELSKDALIRQLEDQLQLSHEQLQSTIEQLETSNEGFMSVNEELISMNEEFQSTNEELQSANEELETSKEELQTLNEELITVNAELRGKVDELDRANNDMENLLSSSGIATIFLDRQLNIKRFTPAMAELCNLIPADVGRPSRLLAGSFDCSSLSQDAEEVMEKQIVVERDVSNREKGTFHLMRVLPYRGTDGGIEGVVVTLIDLSERKRSEEELRESEEHYRSLFDNMLNGYAFCKMLYDNGVPDDFIYLSVNAAFEKQTGLKDVEGKRASEVIPGIRKSDPFLIKAYGRVALTGKPVRFERFVEALGEWFSVAVYSPKRDYFVAVFDVVTGRKLADQQREKADRLEALGILAGGIAHDFNNILTGVTGNISLARMQMGGEHRADQRLSACEKALGRAADVVRQLMTFTKGGEPVREALDTGQLLREVISFALHGSPCMGELDLPGDIWNLDADGSQIHQALNNLLLNAAQSMPDGGIISVKGENAPISADNLHWLAAGNYVRITVSDQGCGIAPEVLPKIFDPYFSTKPTGSGIGLASVFSIVNRHDGAIDVTSEPGCGSTFTLYLPASDKTPSQAAIQLSEEGGGAASRTILLMDDEEMIRDLGAEMLKELEYDVVTCSGGEEALLLYRRAMEEGKPFSAAILDMTIPGGMGGLETAQRILTVDPSALLIISSGYSLETGHDPEMSRLFKGVVAKPYSVEQLSRELERLFGKR